MRKRLDNLIMRKCDYLSYAPLSMLVICYLKKKKKRKKEKFELNEKILHLFPTVRLLISKS
jgi:hypothetical protein